MSFHRISKSPPASGSMEKVTGAQPRLSNKSIILTQWCPPPLNTSQTPADCFRAFSAPFHRWIYPFQDQSLCIWGFGGSFPPKNSKALNSGPHRRPQRGSSVTNTVAADFLIKGHLPVQGSSTAPHLGWFFTGLWDPAPRPPGVLYNRYKGGCLLRSVGNIH